MIVLSLTVLHHFSLPQPLKNSRFGGYLLPQKNAKTAGVAWR
jgi:hypothetical protein